MTQEDISTPSPSLNEVQKRIEQWRKGPHGPRLMPEELWEAAASLSKNYSVYKICKTLRVSYRSLKQPG